MNALPFQDSSIRVLLVEDDPDLAEMYRVGLERDGYAVTVAADGSSGLRLATTAAPAIVLLDLALPRMRGLEMLRALRASAQTRRLPVLLLTNEGDPATLAACEALGIEGRMTKSEVTPAEVSRAIRSSLTLAGQTSGPI